jgi:signal transduction histidine kinase
VSPRVLIAEADLVDLDCLRRCLAPCGADVVVARSPSEVVDAFSPGTFDLVVLSLDLPGIDPLFVLGGIKSADPEVSILAIGGGRTSRTGAVSLGAAGVLGRPLDEAALTAWVNTLCRFRRAKSDALRASKDLTLVQRERQEVLASLVHDLNNPIAIVHGNVRWSRDHLDPGQLDLADALDDAIQGVERLRSMVESLLMVSRLDSGQVALRREKIGIQDLIDDALKAHEGRAREKNISMSMKVEGAAEVDGDPQVLRRILDSLIENSMRNTPASGQIRLSVKSSGGVEIRVANSGAPTIATPRANLDLYFCKRAVEAHDGALELAQTEDRERELIVRFPTVGSR